MCVYEGLIRILKQIKLIFINFIENITEIQHHINNHIIINHGLGETIEIVKRSFL